MGLPLIGDKVSGSFTATAQEFDYFGNVEGGAAAVKFTHEQKQIAQELIWDCEDQIDNLWFTMFDEVQERTGLANEEVYLLLQKVQYRGKKR